MFKIHLKKTIEEFLPDSKLLIGRSFISLLLFITLRIEQALLQRLIERSVILIEKLAKISLFVGHLTKVLLLPKHILKKLLCFRISLQLQVITTVRRCLFVVIVRLSTRAA